MEVEVAKCGKRTEVFSRVCGYFRPVTSWNKGKKEEFSDRKMLKMEDENDTKESSKSCNR